MSSDHNGYGVSAEAFQGIIRERKAEKIARAEEKRVEGLKSIRDRKSKTGIDPLQQFPKEVWEMVLETLDDPKDLCNVSQVHNVFSDLLERRKVRDLLFPQVVGLLNETDPTPYRKVLPLARDLKMRAVSKSMRNGIDRWLENNLLQHLRSGKNVMDRDAMPTVCLSLNYSKEVKGFLKNFLGSGSEESMVKRFLQRSLTAELLTPFIDENPTQGKVSRRCQKYANFRNDIRSFLEVIGDQVWHFVYFVGSMDVLEKGGITHSHNNEGYLSILVMIYQVWPIRFKGTFRSS